MKKKKPTTATAKGNTSGKLLVEVVEPIEVMSSSQSSCQIKFGQKTTEVQLKSYADEAHEAVNEAVKEFKRAMFEVGKIDKKYRKKN